MAVRTPVLTASSETCAAAVPAPRQPASITAHIAPPRLFRIVCSSRPILVRRCSPPRVRFATRVTWPGRSICGAAALLLSGPTVFGVKGYGMTQGKFRAVLLEEAEGKVAASVRELDDDSLDSAEPTEGKEWVSTGRSRWLR